MKFSRRQFCYLTTACLLTKVSIATAADDAVFWRVKFPTYEVVLFGYVRIPVREVPLIFAEGKRLIDATQAVVLDMNADVPVASIDFGRRELGAIIPKLAAPMRLELRAALSTSPFSTLGDDISGYEAMIALLAEGQVPIGPTAPSIGETFLKYAEGLHRPISKLLEDEEAKAAVSPLTLEKAKSVGPDQIGYLLELRRRVGPIGTYMDALYRTRRVEEVAELGKELEANGADLMINAEPESVRALLIDRLSQLVGGTNPFTMLPIGLLRGRYSILPDLQARGGVVTAIG